MLKPRLFTTCIFIVSACAAPHPKSIKPMTISPTAYDGWTCEQLTEEQLNLWKRKEDLRIPLKRAAEDIPLFGGTHTHATIEREYAEKLGHLQALDLAAYKHDCSVRSQDELKALYGLTGEIRPRWPSTEQQD